MANDNELYNFVKRYPRLPLIQVMTIAQSCGIRITNGYDTPITSEQAILLERKLEEIEPTIKEGCSKFEDITKKHPKLSIEQVVAIASECGIRITNGYATPIAAKPAALLERKLKAIESSVKKSNLQPSASPTQNVSKQVEPKKQQNKVAPKQKKKKKCQPQEPITYFQETKVYFPVTPSVPKVRRLRILKKSEYTANEECIRKVLDGVSLPLSTYDAIKRAIKLAKDRYRLTPFLLVHIYHHLANNLNLQKYFVDNFLCRYVETSILKKRNGTEDTYEKKLLDIYKKQNNEPALDILKPQEFNLNWNDVTFYAKWIRIDPPRIGNVKFTPLAVANEKSIYQLNYLKEYMQRRLPLIRCVAKDNKLTLLDEIDLSQAIRYMKEENIKDILDPENDGIKKKPIVSQAMNFEDALAKGDNYTPAELYKLKSPYINHLASLQVDGYKVIPCIEKLSYESNDTKSLEKAFIFTLAGARPSKLVIAVENVNIDRATMLFSFRRSSYDKVLRGIFNYIQSPGTNKRSNLRKWERYSVLDGIPLEYRAVNHRREGYQHSSNYRYERFQYSWYDTLKYHIRSM